MPFEVELRGPLTTKELNNLLTFLETNGQKIKESDEFVLFFPENSSLNIEKDQLRIKKNDYEEKIVFKDHFGSETEVMLKKDELKNIIKLFSLLNFNLVTLAPARRWDFVYKGITFSLKTNCIIGPHFEAELITELKEKINEVKEKITKVILDLNLNLWSNEEYSKHKKECWKNIQPIELNNIYSLLLKGTIDSAGLIDYVIHQSKTQ